MMIRIVLLFIFTILCSYHDLKFRKIPNIINMSFMLIAIVWALLFPDKNVQFYDSILGLVIPFVALFVFFLIRSVGAGDIKQLMVIGALMGYRFLINAFVWIALVAGIMVIFKLIKERNLKERLSSFFRYIWTMLKIRSLMEYDQKYEEKNNIPFAVAVFFGVFINLYMQHIGIFIFV